MFEKEGGLRLLLIKQLLELDASQWGGGRGGEGRWAMPQMKRKPHLRS